jgi:ubiquinone/menaquinone biosynthesis C-methylase UbiE
LTSTNESPSNVRVTFSIPAAAYDRFMGRYSMKLAPLFADFARVTPGMHLLDVGCGSGALAGELIRRVGAAHVAGIEPSQTFFEACHARFPDADIRHGGAEQLPWNDDAFDAALAQLVLPFVSDADRVAREMRRVVREGGVVAACMWLDGASMQMTDLFWEAASTIEPALRDREGSMPYRKQGEIAALWERTGLLDVQEADLEVRVTYRDFDDFWEPLLTAAGPIGAYMASVDDERRAALREACRVRLGNPQRPFELTGRACAVRGS